MRLCEQGRGSPDEHAHGRGAWSCSRDGVRARGWCLAQPPLPVPRWLRNTHLGERSLPLQPGAYSISQLAFKDGDKTFGGAGWGSQIVISSNPPSQQFSTHGGFSEPEGHLHAYHCSAGCGNEPTEAT